MKIIKYAAICLAVLGAVLWLMNRIMNTETVEVDEKLRQQAEGQFIRLTDGVTHYQLKGPENGEVVVLIAGATLPVWVWNDLDERLVGAGYRVLMYDIFGRGYSDRPDTVYDNAFHARQFQELVDRVIPGSRFHIINLTFGAIISSEYILKNPDRVRSMTSIGPDGFGLEAKFSTRMILGMPDLMAQYVFSTFGTGILMGRLDNYSTFPDVVRKLKELYRPTLDRKGFKHAVLSTVRNMPITDARDLFQKVSKTDVPIYLVWGRDDIVTPFPGEERVKASFPKAALRVEDRMGHLPQFEFPEKFATLLIDFLKKHSEQK